MINRLFVSPHSERATHAQWVLVALLTLFGLALRLFKAAEWGFWIDEMYTLRDAEVRQLGQLTFRMTRGALAWFGRSELSLRSPSIFLGTLTIPALYVALRPIIPRWQALLAVTLLTVAPWHIYWSQNARFYASILLFYTLALLFFYLATTRTEKRWLWLLGAAVCLAVAVLDRIFALFFVPVASIYLFTLTLTGRSPISLKKWGWLGVVGVLGMAAVLWFVRDNVSVFVAWFVGSPNYNPVRLTLELALNMGLPLTIAAGVGTLFALRERTPLDWLLVCSAWVPVLLLMVMSLFVLVNPRYVFLCFPSWILLAVRAIRPSMGRAAVLVLLAILLVEPLTQDVLYYAYLNGNRPNWRTPLTDIHATGAPGDRVLTLKPELAAYYTPDTDNLLIDGTVDPALVAPPRPAIWLMEAPFALPDAWQEWAADHCKIVSIHDVQLVGRTHMMRTYYCPAVP